MDLNFHLYSIGDVAAVSSVVCLGEIPQLEGSVSVPSVGSDSRPWSGSNLCHVSVVALHLVRIWDRSSSAGWSCGWSCLVAYLPIVAVLVRSFH